MRRLGKPWLVLTAISFASAIGCTTNLGSFTLVASKNVDLHNFTSAPGDKGASVTGHDSKFGTIASIEEAVDKAVEPSGAKALTNARLSIGNFMWWNWADATGNPSKMQ
jgi:hypothetical protein